MSRSLLAGLAALLLLLAAGPARAQQGVPLAGQGSGPIQIEATQTLEWHSELKLYVARGDAWMKRGTLEVRADTLTAYYRDLPTGGTEIWRMTADGNVVVTSPQERAQGDQGVYDVDRDVFVLTGNNLKFETPTDVVTARDSLEYWQGQRIAVARGNAVAVRGTDRVAADTLSAELVEGAGGALTVNILNAYGNVVVTTPTDVARGDQGVYNLTTRIATLSGSVRLNRGPNQLNGDYGEVNLDTGVSRLLARPGPESRVRGLLVPNQQ